MKNLVKILALCTFMFVLIYCDDHNNDNRVYFYDEPAIVESLDNDTLIKAAHGEFLVNSLDKSLRVGNLLWTVFEVDLNGKKEAVGTESYYRATGFKYKTVDSSKVIIPAGVTAFEEMLADDYTENIDLAVLYNDYVEKLLFFGFQNESSGDTGFVYEIILNPEKEENTTYPTLYIRAKKLTIVPASTNSKHETIFAFDMSDFVKYYRNNISEDGPVKFNLKYKTGTKDDKDVYRGFQSNPLSWHIK
jgi:hypothetical protein